VLSWQLDRQVSKGRRHPSVVDPIVRFGGYWSPDAIAGSAALIAD
jgi:hypothetical protein